MVKSYTVLPDCKSPVAVKKYHSSTQRTVCYPRIDASAFTLNGIAALWQDKNSHRRHGGEIMSE
ncbi:hypothetical protein DZJ_50950 [Dickeya ananatis]